MVVFPYLEEYFEQKRGLSPVISWVCNNIVTLIIRSENNRFGELSIENIMIIILKQVYNGVVIWEDDTSNNCRSQGGRADLFLGGWDEVTLSCEILTAFGKLCFVGVTGLAFALRLSGFLNWVPIVGPGWGEEVRPSSLDRRGIWEGESRGGRYAPRVSWELPHFSFSIVI